MRLLSLLLALAAVAPAHAAEAPLEVYTTTADGSLTIGANGEVLAVELKSGGNLGTGVLEGFEQRIRAWRFEPITEDGRPVNAVGRMHLVLVAAKRRGESTATFGINRVQFLDPPGATPGPAGDAMRPDMPPPRYPNEALRAGRGARLELLVRVDAEGRPTDVAVERLMMFGGASADARLAGKFRSATEAAVRKWRIPGQAPGGVVSVPVTFRMSGEGWVRTVAMQTEMPAWAVMERQSGDAVAVGEGGAKSAEAIRLLTPLDEMAEAADGG